MQHSPFFPAILFWCWDHKTESELPVLKRTAQRSRFRTGCSSGNHTVSMTAVNTIMGGGSQKWGTRTCMETTSRLRGAAMLPVLHWTHIKKTNGAEQPVYTVSLRVANVWGSSKWAAWINHPIPHMCCIYGGPGLFHWQMAPSWT